MKLEPKQIRSVVNGVSAAVAFAGVWLVRYLLDIPSLPFDFHSSGHFVGWFLILIAFSSLCRGTIRIFFPVTDQPKTDAYSLAAAELQAERAAPRSAS